MDPKPAPWRVLEDPVGAAPGGEAPRPGAASVSAPAPPLVSRWAVVTCAVAGLLAIGAFLLAAGSSSGSVAVEGGAPLTSPGLRAGSSPDAATAVAASGRIVVVEVVGAVDHPGVFRLPAGSRVGDLVAAAGGYGARVDTDRAAHDLNLAAPLADGDQIRVPSRDDPARAPGATAGSGTPKGSAAAGAPIDLNRATAEQLDTLPGIGPATAAKILASRAEQPFASVDDLRTRKLIGEKTFGKLKDLVTVR